MSCRWIRPEKLETKQVAHRHVRYNATSGEVAASNVSLDINGPRFILAADPLYALMDFATLNDDNEEDDVDAEIADDLQEGPSATSATNSAKKPESSMSIQLNVSDAAVLLLASDSVQNTGLIELRIAQMVLTKQVKPMRLLRPWYPADIVRICSTT